MDVDCEKLECKKKGFIKCTGKDREKIDQNQYWITFEKTWKSYLILNNIRILRKCLLFTIQTNKYKVIINTNGSLDNQFST